MNVKYALILTTATVTYALLFSIELWCTAMNFGLPNLSANIASMPRFSEISRDISILSYLTLYKAVGLAGFLCFTALTTSLSAIFENQMKTVTASGAAAFVSYAMKRLGVGFFGTLDINCFICPEMLVNGKTTYIIYIAAAAFSLIAARKKWNGREKQVKKT